MKISGLDKSFYRSFIKTKKALVQQEGTIFQRYLAIQRKNHILFLQKLSTQIPHIDERKKIFVLIPAFYEQENILRTLESLYPKSKALEKFWQKKVVFLILNNYLPSRKETVTFQKTNLFKRKTGFRDVYVINLRHPGGGYNVGQCRKILHDLIIYLSVNTNRKLDNCVFASFDADILSSDLGIFKKAYRLLQQNPKIDAIQGKMTRLPKEFSPDKSLFFFFSTFYHYVRDEWQDQRFRKHGTPLYSLMWNRVFTYGTNLFLRPSTYCQIGGFEEVGLGEDYSIGAKISFLRARDGIRSAYVNTIKFLEYRTVNSPRRDLHCFPSQFFGAKQVYEKFGEYKFEKALRRNNSDLNEIYTILNNRYPLNKENVLKTLRIVSQKSLARISNPRENTALIDRALRRSVTDLKKTLGSQLSRFLLKRLEQKKILNDYTHAEQLFFAKTRLSLVSSNVKKNPTHLKKTSVIIPVFDDPANFRKTLLALKKQILPKAFLGHIEVVVVDDGSTKKDSKKLRESITKEPLPFKVILLRIHRNKGRSFARNLGVFHANGEILVFLDAGVIPNRFWLLNHVVRHSVCSNIVTLGFNESVASAREFSLRALKQNYGELLPRYTKDFRYCKKIPKSWLKVRPDLNPEVINQKYCLLKQTDFFKNFPFPETIGVWTLPSMFLAGNVALSKNAFTKVGGFDLRFRGWGMEDTHLGYKLINSGLFLVPVLSCTAFHIRDSIRKQVGRRGEFKENIALYNKLVERGSVTQVREWADRMQKTLKNKFKVVYK